VRALDVSGGAGLSASTPLTSSKCMLCRRSPGRVGCRPGQQPPGRLRSTAGAACRRAWRPASAAAPACTLPSATPGLAETCPALPMCAAYVPRYERAQLVAAGTGPMGKAASKACCSLRHFSNLLLRSAEARSQHGCLRHALQRQAAAQLEAQRARPVVVHAVGVGLQLRGRLAICLFQTAPPAPSAHSACQPGGLRAEADSAAAACAPPRRGVHIYRAAGDGVALPQACLGVPVRFLALDEGRIGLLAAHGNVLGDGHQHSGRGRRPRVRLRHRACQPARALRCPHPQCAVLDSACPVPWPSTRTQQS